MIMIKAASESLGQCKDELCPAERLTETCLEQVQVKFGTSESTLF